MNRKKETIQEAIRQALLSLDLPHTIDVDESTGDAGSEDESALS